jgi:predicted dehydrogenase
VRAYADADELIAEPHVDLVSICTRTDTHSDLAVRALRAGKHVLVEKPVALDVDDVRRVRDAARESGKLCMPAMCMRFWPAWAWLKARIDDGTLGRCSGLTLTRVGAAPSWSGAFYADASRSGGALADLHVHDADFVLFCFGRPSSLYSVGDVNHVTTAYRFDRRADAPAHVVAEGAWLAPGTAFRMRYVAAFARATADFDLARDPQLVLYRDGKADPVDVPPRTGYDEEVRHVVAAVASRGTDLAATMDDAVAVTELLVAERASLERREIVQL